jgi:hypothetical protein
MAKLIIKPTAGFAAREVELKAGVNRLGRSLQNDISFPFPEISELHCEILVEEDTVFVRDLQSSNGTLLDGEPIRESAIYPGQTLQIGNLEMVLDAQIIRLSLPTLPKPESVEVPKPVLLPDGYPCCLRHVSRHAIWECPNCTRVYCDECIRKLRRVGGAHLKLCPACSNPCRLTAWSEKMRKKRKSFFSSIISKVTDTVKRSTSLLKGPTPPPPEE